MRIGKLELKNPFILAPMAGFSESVFRKIVAKAGAGLVVTEMVSAKGLIYGNENTLDLLRHGSETTSVQLFGSEPDVIKDAVMHPLLNSFDMIDLNMGCPVPKVINVGAGAILMKNLPLASKIISSAKLNSKVPVSVKCRLGWNREQLNIMEFARMCADSGADMICIHGRTKEDYYSGDVNYEIIGKVKEKVSIPVVGNGDIISAEQARLVMEKYNLDGVAIGRGALGNPFIFSELTNTKFNCSLLDIINYHYQKLAKLWGEKVAVPFMRKHLIYYLKHANVNKRERTQFVLESDYHKLMDSLNLCLKMKKND